MRAREILPIFIPTFIFILMFALDFGLRSSLAVSIISFVISTTLLIWRKRLAAGIFGLALAFVFNILPFELFLEFMHMDIILFLLGMMVVVGYLEEVNYFDYIIAKLIPHLHGHPKKFYSVLIALTALFAAIVDEVTAILFTSVIMLELSSIYKVEPRKFLLPITYAVIVGGTATVMGDPVAILVAFNGGLTMVDFFIWATPVTVATVVIVILYTFVFLRNDLEALGSKMREVDVNEIINILSKEATNTRKATILFLAVLIPIIIHGEIASLLNMMGVKVKPKLILVSVALIAAAYIIAFEGDMGIGIFLHRVDWQTLVFLMSFFSLVGSLEYVGLLNVISKTLVDISGGETEALYLLISGITAILSPILDNVLTVATISPIVNELAALGVETYHIWFGILFAGVFSALATPIGTSASLVMLGLLEKRRLKAVTIGEWVKMGLPLAIIVTTFALFTVYVRAYGLNFM